MSKYNFYYDDKNAIICTSHYAGKVVRAVAKCHPNDKFDWEQGCALAQARCDVKIATKRKNRARMKFAEACKRFEEAKEYMDNMRQYFADAINGVDAATVKLMNLEEEL